MSAPLSERSRSAKRNENVNGGVNVDVAVDSCVDDTVDGEGASLSFESSHGAIAYSGCVGVGMELERFCSSLKALN